MFKKSKRYSFIVPILLIVLILSTLGIAVNFYFEKENLNQSKLKLLPTYHKLMDSEIEQQTKVLSSYIDMFKDYKELHSPFLARDKETLFKNSIDIYKNINKNNDVTHFYFLDTNGKVILRVHDPERHSDIVKRYTFLKAKESAEVRA